MLLIRSDVFHQKIIHILWGCHEKAKLECAMTTRLEGKKGKGKRSVNMLNGMGKFLHQK